MRTIAFTCLMFVGCGNVPPDTDAGGGRIDTPASLSGSPVVGINFGDVVLGQSSKSSYAITNDGDLPSSPIAIALDNGAIGFSITDDTCSGRALDHQQMCSFAVAYSPTSASNAMTTVHVTATPSKEVARVVSGNGLTRGAVSIAESGFAFDALGIDAGAKLHAFTVQNGGQVAIGVPIPTIAGSNADSYGIASTTCLQMLAPDAQCQVVVRFDPSTVGDKPASLTVSSSPGGSDAATLSGTGTAHVAISKTGTGAGVVQSNQAGIDCGTSCSGDFASTPVMLNATPAAGSTFAGWSNACTGTGSCTLDLTGTKMVTAVFTAITPQLTVTLAGNGSGSVGSVPGGISCGTACAASFPFGMTVTLSVTPQAGSTFAGWTGACSGTSTCTVAMTQARAVTASFTQDTRDLVLSTVGSGTVTPSPMGASCGAGCFRYTSGTSVTLTATPTTGNGLASWVGCTSTTNVCSVTMTQARSVTATFTVCPAAPPPTELVHRSNEGGGGNCFGENNFVIRYGGLCTSGRHRVDCRTIRFDSTANSSCTANWVTSNANDCTCDVAFHVPQGCAESLHCEVIIREAINPPPPPIGCP